MTDAAQTSHQIDRELLEVGQLNNVERGFVRRIENHPRGFAGQEGFTPTRGAQTPPVAGFEPGKTVLRMGGRQIIAPRTREPEKLIGHHTAHRVATDILIAGRTATVTKKPRFRRIAAPTKRPTQHSALHAAKFT